MFKYTGMSKVRKTNRSIGFEQAIGRAIITGVRQTSKEYAVCVCVHGLKTHKIELQ